MMIAAEYLGRSRVFRRLKDGPHGQLVEHYARHSAAMELLQAGVDCSVIALWLGHESIETTQTYLHAHLALKEAALAKLKPYQSAKQIYENSKALLIV